MTRRIRSLFRNFRLPSISAVIADVEKTYLEAAETLTEREARRREIAAGRFRREDW